MFDHHHIEKIIKVFQNHDSQRKLILTTEKDAMRLEMHKQTLLENKIPVYVLPAKVKFHFDEGKAFEDDIRKFLLDFEV